MDIIETILVTVLIIMIAINILLHSLGIYLLQTLNTRNEDAAQDTFIIHLSIQEILSNFFAIIIIIIKYVDFDDSIVNSVDYFVEYLFIVDHTILTIPFYLLMICIIMDKFLEIYLNIKYPLYCSAERVSFIVKTIWFVGSFVGTAMLVTFATLDFDYETFDRYTFLIFDFIILILVISTHAYIFYRFVATRMQPVQKRTISSGKRRILDTFKNSRFYVSTLLIASFLLFIIIPDLTYEFSGLHYNSDEKSLDICGFAIAYLYTISYLCDACIYIFAKAKVRRLFRRKLRKILNRNDYGLARDKLRNRSSITNIFSIRERMSQVSLLKRRSTIVLEKSRLDDVSSTL